MIKSLAGSPDSVKWKKSPFIIFLLIVTSVQTFAGENEQRIPTSISNVTVFINQAQITKTGKVSLNAGNTILVFDHLSPFINLNSIQVRTDNSLSLMSVTHRTNFLAENETPSFILNLEDSLQSIDWALENLKNRKQVYQLEKEMMQANRSIGGQNSGVKVEDLEDALVLFRKRMLEINDEILKATQQEKKLSAIRVKIEQQLNESRAGLGSNAPEILVAVKAIGSVTNAKIEISYLVSNASWRPFYDIRVKDTKSPLQLVSKAFITQQTGEDWKNVILKLSTSNPNESGTKPELQTNYLRFNEYETLEKMNYKSVPSMAPAARKASADGDMNYSTGIANVQQTAINIEFQVASAYTIPSDNNPHQVDLTVNNLEAVYAYGTVPKMDKDAFVTAKVAGTDLVNQISGEANIYFDGTFIGKTFINGTANDSLLISLGRDKRIQIQRLLLKDFCSKTFTGSNKKELNAWEITVKNTRKEPITIRIEDQIPVSTDKDIEIKLLQAQGATFNETTGKLEWILVIPAEQSQSVKFSFEVKFPKDKVISPY